MIIRSADRPLQAWKNGMGRTREIAIHPSAAGGDDFLWRVSVAEVDSAAPFSVFAGIDRSIVLLDGAGFSMTLDHAHTHALTTPFVPFAFPGEASVSVHLAGGPTRDFNLMVRRARASGRIEVWRERGSRNPGKHMALLYCARGQVDTVDGPLREGDAWRADALRHETLLELHDDTVLLAVRIEAT